MGHITFWSDIIKRSCTERPLSPPAHASQVVEGSPLLKDFLNLYTEDAIGKLTNMPIRNLTFEEKTKFEKEARVLKERIDSWQAMPVHHQF